MKEMIDYFDSLVRELESKYDRLGKLISHKYTEGVFRENLIKDLLKAFLSESISVRSGFIKSSKTGQASKQIDLLLINERVSFAYYYKDENICIARDEAVLAAIEVKSRLTQKSLGEITENIKSVKAISPRIRYAAFLYHSSTRNFETVESWFRKSFILPKEQQWYPDRISIMNFGTFLLYHLKEDQDWCLSFGKPHHSSESELKTHILIDFVATQIGAAIYLSEGKVDNIFSELGMKNWTIYEDFCIN